MAEKQSTEMAHDRLFYAVEEVAGLCPPKGMRLDHVAEWFGLLSTALTEVAEAAQAFTIAAGEAQSHGHRRVQQEQA